MQRKRRFFHRHLYSPLSRRYGVIDRGIKKSDLLSLLVKKKEILSRLSTTTFLSTCLHISSLNSFVVVNASIVLSIMLNFCCKSSAFSFSFIINIKLSLNTSICLLYWSLVLSNSGIEIELSVYNSISFVFLFSNRRMSALILCISSV